MGIARIGQDLCNPNQIIDVKMYSCDQKYQFI